MVKTILILFTTMAKTALGELIEHLNERICRIDKMEEYAEDKLSIAMEKLALTEVRNNAFCLLKTERFWLTHARVNGMHNVYHLADAVANSESWYEDVFGESMDELFVSLTHGKPEEEV